MRNLRRHSVVDRCGRMQRVVPEIVLQLHPANILIIIFLALMNVLLALVRCILVNLCLRVGFGVIDDFVEQGVGIEVEDGGVGVVESEVGGEIREACVPV